MQRMLERYGIELTLDQYYQLVKLAQKESCTLYSLNSANSVKVVEFSGKRIWLIYGCSSQYKNTYIPGRIKTILVCDWSKFPVPDKFARLNVDGTTLANDVREILGRAKEFAFHTIPYITPKQLFTEARFDDLNKCFKTLALKWEKMTPEVRLRLAFKYVFDDYESRYKNLLMDSVILH